MTALVPGEQRSTFDLVPSARDLAVNLAKTEFVPTALRNRPDAIMACVLSGHELGVPPLQSLKQIHIIEGRPGLSAELMRALALREGHEVWFEATNNTSVTICGKRAGTDNTTKVTWTLDDAKKAGLDGRQNWRKYPRAMLIARATSELMRMSFPDVLAGFSYSMEELEDGFDLEDQPDETPAAATTVKRSAKKVPAKKAAARRQTAAPKSGSGEATVPPPAPPLPGEDPDDDIVDAEIVDDDDPPAPDHGSMTAAQKIAMRCDELGVDRHELIAAVTGGRKTSGKELDDAEASTVFEAIRQIKVGEKRIDEVDDMPVLVDVEPAEEDAGSGTSDEAAADPPWEWSPEEWRAFLKTHGVKVFAVIKEAKDLTPDGESPPTSLEDIRGRESLAALLQGFVLEQAGEG